MARMRKVLISTCDEYLLQLCRYEPLVESNPKHVVIINSGAGIPQSFYRPYAAWLANHGFYVVTYDYRGIGGSRKGSIKGLEATIEDWGSKDCAATIAYAKELYREAHFYLLGHSIGSIVTGFVTQLPKIERMLLISPHTGYFGDYARAERRRMFVLWHVLMPVVCRAFGYFPGRRIGLPEDLPYSVAMEWGGRRRKRDLRNDEKVGVFGQLATRVLVLRPKDDAFATKAAYDRIRAKFFNCQFADRELTANHPVGHFDFFRRSCRDSFWITGLRWLALGELP